MVVGAKKRSQAEKGQFVEKRQELGLGLGPGEEVGRW